LTNKRCTGDHQKYSLEIGKRAEDQEDNMKTIGRDGEKGERECE